MIASVMAKKIACGAEIVVIDIPVGAEAKVKDMDDARRLARQFIEIGERFKVKVECAVTFGDTPIGRGIGVNLEVREALIALEGNVEQNPFTQKSLTMAGIAFEMAGRVEKGEGYRFAEEILNSGKALAKMKEIIAIQGGNPNVTSNDILPGKYSFNVNAKDRREHGDGIGRIAQRDVRRGTRRNRGCKAKIRRKNQNILHGMPILHALPVPRKYPRMLRGIQQLPHVQPQFYEQTPVSRQNGRGTLRQELCRHVQKMRQMQKSLPSGDRYP